MSKTSRTRYAVLGALELGLATGYEMRSFFAESIGHFWSESYGQLYPVLKRLEAEGLATSQQAGRRREYTITDAGQAVLKDWLARPAELHTPRMEILLKLFFGRHLDRAAALAHVERHEQELRAAMTAYEGVDQQLQAMPADHPDRTFWRLTLRYGQLGTEAGLAWCAEARALLETP